MSSQQHPGGVAGRVIRECENERYGGLIANGAYRMRDEMSREARAILSGLGDPWARLEFERYCERLGLNLESEDE